jgi:hypothetical protein
MSVNVNYLHTLAAEDEFTPFAVGNGLCGGLPRVSRKTK